MKRDPFALAAGFILGSVIGGAVSFLLALRWIDKSDYGYPRDGLIRISVCLIGWGVGGLIGAVYYWKKSAKNPIGK